MKSPRLRHRAGPCSAFLAMAWILGTLAPVRADDALFIGNSFTRSLPAVVEAIAKAKGKSFATEDVIKGGKNWEYHLTQPETGKAISEKKWNWVILQDLSTEPTRIGNVDKFMADGEKLYRIIHEASPNTTVVLYQTWALDEDNALFAKDAKKFANPAEMTADLVKNYAALAKKLEEIDPGTQMKVAPVGEAFAKCQTLYPDIAVMGPDNKHPSDTGRYLSALVMFATLYNESPIGPDATPGIKVKPDIAAKLQKVADEVTKPSRDAGTKKP